MDCIITIVLCMCAQNGAYLTTEGGYHCMFAMQQRVTAMVVLSIRKEWGTLVIVGFDPGEFTDWLWKDSDEDSDDDDST